MGPQVFSGENSIYLYGYPVLTKTYSRYGTNSNNIPQYEKLRLILLFKFEYIETATRQLSCKRHSLILVCVWCHYLAEYTDNM
jgi:hypothetical protein